MKAIDPKMKVNDSNMETLSKVFDTKTESAHWYLLHLKPRGFARAVENLKRQHVQTFMPLCPLSGVNNGVSHSYPLFPGYLFASFDPLHISFSTINSTLGVSRIVTAGCDALTGLPLNLIRSLQARCDSHGRLVPLNDLEMNETVRITAGPFVEFIAVVDQLSGPDRVKILFEIMGQAIRTDISANDLERA